jgi:AcrR family transcriptional regulator
MRRRLRDATSSPDLGAADGDSTQCSLGLHAGVCGLQPVFKPEASAGAVGRSFHMETIAQMSDANPTETRRYHHGDLRRALVDAARRLLEAEGPSALSLRGVARVAGVSPAAPYHHFKDKAELLDAVAQEGWNVLSGLMADAKSRAEGLHQLTALGISYVCFARDNPALYRVMYDAARDKDALPEDMHDKTNSSYCMVRDTMIEHGADPNDAMNLELASAAAWCGAHGLAEMAGLKQFEHLKTELGGERQFLQGVLNHMALFPSPQHQQ